MRDKIIGGIIIIFGMLLILSTGAYFVGFERLMYSVIGSVSIVAVILLIRYGIYLCEK